MNVMIPGTLGRDPSFDGPPEPARVLVVNDSDDSELALRELRLAEPEASFERVVDAAELRVALAQQEWDLVLSDYSFQDLDAFGTLSIVAECDPDLPCIVLSDETGEDAMDKVFQAGAYAFIARQQTALLGRIVERALRESADRRRMASTNRALREMKQRFQSVVNDAIDAIITIGERGAIEIFNPAAERLFGFTADEAIGQSVSILMPQPQGNAHQSHVEDYVTTGLGIAVGHSREVMARTKKGETFPVEISVNETWIDDRRVFTGMFRDVRERKAFENQLAHQALHDPLTGLANRTLLMDRINHASARAKRDSDGAAVLLMDLDRFKVVNDSLGHAAGDDLLRSVAKVLTSLVRPADLVARLGGDEFVILYEDTGNAPTAIAIAERVVMALRQPVNVEGAEIVPSASIGIALVDDESKDAEGVLRDADSAMYRAKARGRDRCELFDQQLRAQAVQRLTIEQQLRRAMDRGEFLLHYQPELSLAGGRVVGLEALIRWQHPSRGLLLPGEFLDVAEETGLIVPIGAWVIGEAHRQAQQWADIALSVPTVWVNVSVRELIHSDLVSTVADALDGGDPRVSLGVEITEDALINDPAAATAATRELRALGVHVGIDDFGTGYSSMSYLKHLAADALKLDRSFVRGLGRDPRDAAIVRAAVGLGKALSLDVVAEGVETPTQATLLQELGCGQAQGNYFVPPLRGPEISPLLTFGGVLGPSALNGWKSDEGAPALLTAHEWVLTPAH